MRFFLGLFGLFAMASTAWGGIDLLQTMAPTPLPPGTFDPITPALQSLASLKIGFGVLILAVCIGFDELVRVAHQIAKRMPSLE